MTRRVIVDQEPHHSLAKTVSCRRSSAEKASTAPLPRRLRAAPDDFDGTRFQKKSPEPDRARFYPARIAFTIALALLKSILPAWRSFSAAITLPMSFTLVAPTSFTTSAIAAFASASDICLGR